MNTKKRSPIGRNVDARDRTPAATAAFAEDIQLSFFEAVTPTTMNTATIDDHAGTPVEQSPPAVPGCADASVIAQVTVVPDASTPAEPALGERLRTARETLGMSCEAAAHKLKLPLKVLQALEADQYQRIGYSVYLRGYLIKYLELLDLPKVLADRVASSVAEPPPLVMSGTVSRPHYLFQRYSGSALYLILTGVIIVPAVLLAMRVGLDQKVVRIAPLDTPEVSLPVAAHDSNANANPASAAGSVSATSDAVAPAAGSDTNESPLVASMAPFSAATQPAPSVAVVASEQHGLRLSLAAPSWVEVIAADGRKLEYGLLPAGTVRNYSDDQPLEVRLGNAEGATVQIDGKTQDVSAYRRANVVHFRLASGELSAVHSGG